MVKRLLAMLCAVVAVVGFIAVATPEAQAATALKAGYATVDINPYWSTYSGARKPATLKATDMMPLPMAGYGDNSHRLSAPALLDDNGDGKISGPDGDGLHATTLAIQSGDKTVLIITVDIINFKKAMTTQVRNAITEATGIPGNNIMINGTHTHGGVDLGASFDTAGEPYQSADTATNYTAEECTAYLEHYKTYLTQQLTQGAVTAVKDLSPATMEKGTIDAGVENSGKPMNGVRHYVQKYTEKNGTSVTYVRGSSFNNNVNGDKNYDSYYTNCYTGGDIASWRDTHVSESDDAMHLLRFKVEGKKDILLLNWRGHPASSNKTYKNSAGKTVNIYQNLYSDYIGTIRYGLDSSGYRTTFILGASGNLGASSAFPWESWVSDQATANRIPFAVEYGRIVAQTAKALLNKTKTTTSGDPMKAIESGEIMTSQLKYKAAMQIPSALEIAACKAYQANAADIAAHDSYVYTDSATGDKFVVASSYHANAVVNRSGYSEGATRTFELNVITVGKELSFIAMPYEASDRYSMEATLTTANNYNDWDLLSQVGSFGTPFVMTCSNDHIGYIPNHLAYNYNKDSVHYGKYARGSYESQTSPIVDGEGEKLILTYKDMLEQMQTKTGYCQGCKQEVTWSTLNAAVISSNDHTIPTGHYYLVKDLIYTDSQVSMKDSSKVCLDLNGFTYRVAHPKNASRAMNMSKGANATLNIQDSSKAQTGKMVGWGVLKETAASFSCGTLNIEEGSTANLYSGTLTQDHTEGYHASAGGVVRVSGTFNMYGGTVTGGIASVNQGGNIAVFEKGVFNMYGGTVSGGQAATDGGNVYVTSTAKMNMYGGKIIGGTAENGPSVYAAYSSSNKHSIKLSGTTDALLQISCQKSSANMVQFNGKYTGTVEIKTSGTIYEGQKVAKCGEGADIGGATITVVGMGDWTPVIEGEYVVLRMRSGWMQIGGKWYYFYEPNKAQTGWYQENGDWHYFDENGVMQTGWLELDGKRYYMDADGHRVSGTCLAGNTISVFDEEGVWQNYITGWYTIGEKKYYAGEDGKLVTTWLDLDGTWYYFNPRYEMVTGWLEYGPVWYYFNADGSMFQGFLYYGKQWYFFNSIGRMHIGWTVYQGNWYYMDQNGHRVTGEYVIDGKVNVFDENGVWLKEIAQKNGWAKEDGKWFYYENGAKKTGWLELKGTWYYFKTSGELVTGWLAYGPVWYYFNSDGDMRLGWLTYGGKTYYFDKAATNYGRMAVNKWIQDGGKWYYFDANGYMVTGSRTIGGKTYNFDANGVCLNP